MTTTTFKISLTPWKKKFLAWVASGCNLNNAEGIFGVRQFIRSVRSLEGAGLVIHTVVHTSESPDWRVHWELTEAGETLVKLCRLLPEKIEKPVVPEFMVIDLQTGQEARIGDIARTEAWANGLLSVDMESFAVQEDGTLILLDELGKYVYCPPDRFEIRHKPKEKKP